MLVGLGMAWNCAAAGAVAKMRPSPKPRPAQLLLYDFGYASPFAVSVGLYGARRECPAGPSQRVLGIEVVDFSEAAERATFCVGLEGHVWNVALSQVDDASSEVGRAAVVAITYQTERGLRQVKVRVTPWAASMEP